MRLVNYDMTAVNSRDVLFYMHSLKMYHCLLWVVADVR